MEFPKRFDVLQPQSTQADFFRTNRHIVSAHALHPLSLFWLWILNTHTPHTHIFKKVLKKMIACGLWWILIPKDGKNFKCKQSSAQIPDPTLGATSPTPIASKQVDCTQHTCLPTMKNYTRW